jgi:hypothetical protein
MLITSVLDLLSGKLRFPQLGEAWFFRALVLSTKYKN